MSKMKTRVLGILLAMCVFGGSAFSCYAATTSLTVNVTASMASARLDYGEQGHQLKVTMHYEEIDSGKHTRSGDASNTLNGSYTAVTVYRSSTDGYQYVCASAKGYVDGALAASTRTEYV